MFTYRDYVFYCYFFNFYRDFYYLYDSVYNFSCKRYSNKYVFIRYYFVTFDSRDLFLASNVCSSLWFRSKVMRWKSKSYLIIYFSFVQSWLIIIIIRCLRDQASLYYAAYLRQIAALENVIFRASFSMQISIENNSPTCGCPYPKQNR